MSAVRVPAETPEWRKRFDVGARCVGRFNGRVLIYRGLDGWTFTSEAIAHPAKWADRKRILP